jgi:hypothetical protein
MSSNSSSDKKDTARVSAKRSSVAVLLKQAEVNTGELRRFMYDLANCPDQKLAWLQGKYRGLLRGRSYPDIRFARYRNHLRMLWYPQAKGVPSELLDHYEEWLKDRPEAEPGEMICNMWLRESERTKLLAVWEPGRRELVPSPADLAACLVYGCLLWGDRFSWCGNPKCGAPYFIAVRRGQQYCSNECAWPAKKAAKLKWWRAHQAKKPALLIEGKPRRNRGRKAKQ